MFEQIKLEPVDLNTCQCTTSRDKTAQLISGERKGVRCSNPTKYVVSANQQTPSGQMVSFAYCEDCAQTLMRQTPNRFYTVRTIDEWHLVSRAKDSPFEKAMEEYRAMQLPDRWIIRHAASARLVARGAEEVGSSDRNHEIFAMYKENGNSMAAVIEAILKEPIGDEQPWNFNEQP